MRWERTEHEWHDDPVLDYQLAALEVEALHIKKRRIVWGAIGDALMAAAGGCEEMAKGLILIVIRHMGDGIGRALVGKKGAWWEVKSTEGYHRRLPKMFVSSDGVVFSEEWRHWPIVVSDHLGWATRMNGFSYPADKYRKHTLSSRDRKAIAQTDTVFTAKVEESIVSLLYREDEGPLRYDRPRDLVIESYKIRNYRGAPRVYKRRCSYTGGVSLYQIRSSHYARATSEDLRRFIIKQDYPYWGEE